MEQGDGNIRLLGIGRFQNGGDPRSVYFLVGAGIVAIEQIYAVFAAGRQTQTAHTLGKGHDGHPDALDADHGIAAAVLEFFIAAVNTQRLQAGAADSIQGLLHADDAVGDGIGIGQLQHVHTGGFQRLRHGLGRGGRCSAVRCAVEIAFKIQHRQIGIRQSRNNILEHFGVIVVATLLSCRHGVYSDILISKIVQYPDLFLTNYTYD